MHLTYTYCRPALSKLPPTPIVSIVDDDASMRDTLESIIRARGCEVRTAASAEEFLEHPAEPRPCCLLIEQHLPGSTGLDLQALLGDRSGMSIIFMSRNADVEGTVRAMKAGALEFLTKPFDPDVMLSAVAEAIERS